MEKKIKRIGEGFHEGKICFAPTFKFKAGTDNYSNIREPSWTDRILFRSNDGILQQFNYDSNNTSKLSDHRPVFAQFLLKFKEDEEDNFKVFQSNMEQARASLSKKKKSNKVHPSPLTLKVSPAEQEGDEVRQENSEVK